MQVTREFNNEEKADIQGFITSGYGHLERQGYYFLHFHEAADARQFISTLLEHITTAEDWPRNQFDQKIKPQYTWNIAFTYAGFVALDFPEADRTTFSREFVEGIVTEKRSQVLGDVGDSAPENWEFGGNIADDESTLHALVILYAADDATYAGQDDWIQGRIEYHGNIDIIAQEQGRRPAAEKEHFGFKDGVSNPKVQGFGSDTLEPGLNVVRTGEFILGYYNEYDLAPPTPLVRDDPNKLLPAFEHVAGIDPTIRDFGRNGSYIVYRKLDQDVPGFWNYVQQHSIIEHTGEADQQRMRRIASKFVGRWPNGATLALSPDNDRDIAPNFNEFLYMQRDPKGFGCPYSSHVRRSNPRDSFIGDKAEDAIANANQHRIVRRGSVYGPALIQPDMTEGDNAPTNLQPDGQQRGLHFFCVNADIRRQFEFIQQGWCNNPKFNGLYNDKDPIIGDNDSFGTLTLEEDAVRERLSHLPRFVTVRAAAYLFMPGLSALRYLASL
jgi:Dyp-type peroxidase family